MWSVHPVCYSRSVCDGRLVRNPTAPLYPTMAGGLRLVPAGVSGAGITLREAHAGRLVMDAVFRCVPGGPHPPRGYNLSDQQEHRILVQIRRDVALSVTSLDGRLSRDIQGLVALCALSDPGNEPLTWVQTGHYRPERVLYFDGREEVRDLGRRSTLNNELFSDQGEAWWIDSRSDLTARYAGAGLSLHPRRYSNGEIIYDSPDAQAAYWRWLRDQPDVRLLEATVQFRTYLYRHAGGYRGVARFDPLVLVEWWHTETFERSRAGAEARRVRSDVRVFWILPNPIEPLRLDDAIGAFRYR